MTTHRAPRRPPQADTDIDRVIAELNEPDALTAPAAGLTGGDGSGLLPQYRVGRISEDTSPAQFSQSVESTPRVAEERRHRRRKTGRSRNQDTDEGQPPTGNAPPDATAAAASGNEDGTLPISLRGQDSDGTITGVTIIQIPAGSTLLLADGVTQVLAGQTLTPAQADSLLFRPAPNFNGGTAVSFSVTDDQGAVSAPATVQINVLSVNDTPLTNLGITSIGPEYSAIPVNLGGTDIDGTVASVTVTSLPPGGTLFLADGVTPVVRRHPDHAPPRPATSSSCPAPGSTGLAHDRLHRHRQRRRELDARHRAGQRDAGADHASRSTASATRREPKAAAWSTPPRVDHPVSGSPLVHHALATAPPSPSRWARAAAAARPWCRAPTTPMPKARRRRPSPSAAQPAAASRRSSPAAASPRP